MTFDHEVNIFVFYCFLLRYLQGLYPFCIFLFSVFISSFSLWIYSRRIMKVPHHESAHENTATLDDVLTTCEQILSRLSMSLRQRLAVSMSPSILYIAVSMYMMRLTLVCIRLLTAQMSHTIFTTSFTKRLLIWCMHRKSTVDWAWWQLFFEAPPTRDLIDRCLLWRGWWSEWCDNCVRKCALRVFLWLKCHPNVGQRRKTTAD